ncbi:membrane integrity-associated transporter subunit PqiC [Ideonella sp.]|uniref:PqiC family protein n=1 Tax=Ideonella sp. TaxID=1929293 RepID=UPI0035ADC16B
MRRGDWGWVLLTVAGLAACAGSPAPPVRYYQLRVDPPAAAAAAASAAKPTEASAAQIWQLVSPIHLPDYLDRDALWVAVGSNALQPLDGHRWAEPLRSAVPRTLAHDLGVLLGGADRVYSGSVPSGVVVARQLRLDLLEFGPTVDRRAVHLRARWTASDLQGAAAALVDEAQIEVPSAGSSPEQLVDAHRLALWRLAERMAQAPPARRPSGS